MGKATSLVELILKKWGAPAAGVAAAGQSDDADAGFITKGGKTLLEAWHGSPHKFDKFSMDQIGTGEGAQAYGHGLYFTDTEDIAKQYRDTLSLNGYQDNNANYAKALDLGLSAGEFDRFEGMVRMAATKDGLDAGRISKDLQEYLQWPDDSMPALESFVGDYLDTLPKGALYRTEIDVTPESLLDWDKPLSEQSEAARNAIESLDPATRGFYQYEGEERTGRDFYWGLKAAMTRSEAESLGIPREDWWLGNDERASKMLSDKGIKGIKYLDGSSRHPTQAEADIANEIRELEKKREIAGFMSGTPDVPDLSDSIKSLDGELASRRQALKEMEDARQTSNYVIFDDSLINIAERGNADPRLLAGIAGTTAAGLAAPMIKDSGMISSPRSETLFDLTMGARDIERRLEGSPASLLFPSGLVEYLETVNRREEDPNAMTRGMALLDVLPF